MKPNLWLSLTFLLVLAHVGGAAPPITLEVATEQGVQITAPQEWLQLLAAIGIDNVRIRGIQAGDELKVANEGTPERPRYRLLGFLTSGDQLRLPGGTFSRGDRAALRSYFEKLGTEGAESLTAKRGRFGLTAKELAAVVADLSQPIDFETKGVPANAVQNRLHAKFANRVVVDAAAEAGLRPASPVADELKGLTAGTGLAIILRDIGLVLRPEKLRAQPLGYRIVRAEAESIQANTLGHTEEIDQESWPVGWEPPQTSGRTAPSLFEPRNAEIDGFSLEETLQAIGSRIELPMYLDHALLRTEKIDPAAIQVHLPRTRTIYKRVIDRVLSPSRLYSQIRVDEAGTPFLWITR